MKKIGNILIIIILIMLICIFSIKIYENIEITYNSERYGISFKHKNSFGVIEAENGEIQLVKNQNANILISCVYKEKSILKIDEIQNDFETTFKVFYEGYDVETILKEIVDIDGNEASEVVIRVSKLNKSPRIISTVLIPLEDREITIIMEFDENEYGKSKNTISKFIKSIKFEK